ncbi:hypothetical protein PHYBOEH_008799 [Phytophthora boehmeriae]|uniref:Bzip transcription factor n=1 Tax=Phytophthora boehmeriae TaxID=109152 RepID=A0A8T1W1R9_9STRA|nr:hypothetical protein PHYBOEH_008798 [Phytophthora boehmeriae]KAG7386030.1 hypothetical protein PHYBOEH_008799 [Phytophthora boehmeriae]
MASHFESPIIHFDHFQPTRTRLSDRVIGSVVPRGPRQRHADTYCVGGDKYPDNTPLGSSLCTQSTKRTVRSSDAFTGLDIDEETAKIIENKRAIRRQQCRASQARYRRKQLNMQRQLHQSMQQLREEVQALKLKRKKLCLGKRAKPTPWSIVAEMFRLLETSFQSPSSIVDTEEMLNHSEIQRSLSLLQLVMSPNVTMGELRGFRALLEQLRRYSLYFGSPCLKLGRIEELTPGVLRGTGTLSVTITELTLRWVFPHLKSHSDEAYQSMCGRLLGQRFHCSSSLTFLFDRENGCVEGMETKVDLLEALVRSLKSVEDATVIFEKALITPDGVLGI